MFKLELQGMVRRTCEKELRKHKAAGINRLKNFIMAKFFTHTAKAFQVKSLLLAFISNLLNGE